ncbi:glutathione S-transferase C-terminal domain-containing protein homolog isoform X1 [Macrobrachium rosenbergii]|uniref:glutathione S-transferase C-terminal domain-containing protein homolog isoform X1 n=1 Tax=Macrobrachium rosenbergii TaxID=79674 RepID=UPI0034D67957
MMDQDILYLVGSKEDGSLLVPAETLVALFTLQYCRNPAVSVVIVDKKEAHVSPTSDECKTESQEKVEELWFPVNAECIAFPISYKKLSECPSVVRDCVLPVILMASEPWCVAGLCSSLRVMLIKTVKKYPTHYCKKLLGFRGGCMQACAEVSVWTKFCEIEVVNTLKEVYNGKSVVQGKLCIPKDILRYENHFQFPPILHNGLKIKQQYIRDTVKDRAERQRLLSLKLSELPEMEHEYAEGLNMTMADVMLFTCFHIIISKLKNHVHLDDICPLVMKWYRLLCGNEYINHSLPLLQKTIDIHITVQENNLEIVVPEVQRESLYNSDPERYKPRWRAFTHQDDIDKVLEVLGVSCIEPSYDNHPLGDSIKLPWSEYPGALSPQEGQLPPSRLERKCQQLDNIVSAVMSLVNEDDVIVDFCAGGGHVGIILAYLLPSCKILLVENKDHSLRRAKQRVDALKLKNVEYLQCNLDYFQGTFDLGVCLHACGVATDLVMQKCFEQRAKFVCCPCCYGGVRPNHILEYPRSKTYRDIPLTLEEYLILGHTSDQTHDENNPKTEQGQLCMRFIDNDRLLLAQSLGYSTKLVLMEPKTCSPKNHLLIGVLEN